MFASGLALREPVGANLPHNLGLDRFFGFDEDLMGCTRERYRPTVKLEYLDLAATNRIAEDRYFVFVLAF